MFVIAEVTTLAFTDLGIWLYMYSVCRHGGLEGTETSLPLLPQCGIKDLGSSTWPSTFIWGEEKFFREA